MKILNLINSNLSDIRYDTSIFPGGEIHIRINEKEILGPVHILCRLNNSTDIIRLCMVVDALRGLNVTSITATIPYIPYGRQDRRCSDGEAFSIKVFSNIINSLKLEKIYTFDPHSDVTLALIENIKVIINIKDSCSLVDYVISQIEKDNGITLNHLNILSPDAGQSKKIYKSFNMLYPNDFFSIYECSKTRDLKTTKIIESRVPIVPGPEPILIIDDLGDGCSSFIGMAKKLRSQNNNNDLYLCVTHGIFSHGETELAKYFKHIYTTNSIRDYDYVDSKCDQGTKVGSSLISRIKVI